MSYFSVSYDYITYDRVLPYDLYVNSSALPGKEKFVRVFPQKEYLEKKYFEEIKQKYQQLYVPEKQRIQYLKGLVGSEKISTSQKAKVIKESAIKYLEKIFTPQKEFSTELLAETISDCRDVVEGMVDTIKDFSLAQLYEMIANLSYHDFYTYDHSINVSMYCIAIYREMYPYAEKEQIITAGMGGMLHDLGKLKIPNSIINNPGQLTDEEFDEIKKHPDYGLSLLQKGNYPTKGVNLKELIKVIHQHHENFNGTGYPQGLKGEGISELARITAIADFFDAITTKRSYHEVLSIEEAIDVMDKSKGKKIDPNIFILFARMSQKIAVKDRTDKFFPDSFDPCRPYNSLPFEEVESISNPKFLGKVEAEEEESPKGFGSVKWTDKENKKKKKN